MRDEMPDVPDEAAERLAPTARQLRGPTTASGKYDAEDHDADGGGSVRRREYRGHKIEIATRYEITIDGESWDQHVQVLDDGTVHYHGMPQYQPLSLVNLMERVIDVGYAAPQEVLDAAQGDD